MVESRNTRSRGPGYSAADMAGLAATVTEKLTAMAELSAERAKTTDQILKAQQRQQGQIDKLVIDMAVMTAKQDSFWKSITVFCTILAAGGGVVGFVVAQFMPFFRH